MTTDQDQGTETTAPEGTQETPPADATPPAGEPVEKGKDKDKDKDKADGKPPTEEEEEEEMKKAATTLEAGLKSIMGRVTSALNELKGGKVTPAVVAAIAGIAADAKGLTGKYPSPKVAREFDADGFNAWVAEETQAILVEQDPLMKSLRTAALGESVTEFRKAVSSIENKEAGKVKVKVFMDPMRGAAEPTPPKTVPTPGSPGKPKGVMKGEEDGGTPPADPPPADPPPAGDAPPAAGPTGDPMDDGSWPMDMGNPPAKVGKSADAAQVDVVNRRPGMIGDMNVVEETPAEPPPSADK